jgi:hypothetical protein
VPSGQLREQSVKMGSTMHDITGIIAYIPEANPVSSLITTICVKYHAILLIYIKKFP